MSASEGRAVDVEVTTAMALEEKGHLHKSLRRFDMLFFTVCALVGLDTLGQVSGFGAQTFTWLVILAVLFVFPYALVMAELGAAFTQEGGPYEWMKMSWGRLPAGLGSVLYWITNPLWVGGSLCFIAAAAWSDNLHAIGSGFTVGEHPLQGRVHLDLDRRRDRVAAPRQVDPQRRRNHPHRRAGVLLDHRA